jgi:hypothetical protein
VAAWSKAWDCGRLLASIAGSNSAGSMYVHLSLAIVECFQVEGPTSG